MKARPFQLGLLLLGLLVLPACRQDMHDQPRLEPYEHTTFFADGRGSRLAPAGTVARGERERDPVLETGLVGEKHATAFPFAITKEVLALGREQYDIFCAPCHGRTGYGEGMVVKRGMKAPPSLHEQRLVDAAPGYYVDVITRGFGVMYDYSDRIAPRERWAIAAYVQVLQMSQSATLADVPEGERARLEEERQ